MGKHRINRLLKSGLFLIVCQIINHRVKIVEKFITTEDSQILVLRILPGLISKEQKTFLKTCMH